MENAIGRLRRFLPRGTKLAEVSEERFAAVVLAYNNTPRKRLSYQTSVQVLEEQVLHFKCGFTGSGALPPTFSGCYGRMQ